MKLSKPHVLTLPDHPSIPSNYWVTNWPPLERFIAELFSKQHLDHSTIQFEVSFTQLLQHANTLLNCSFEEKMYDQITTLIGRFISVQMRKILKYLKNLIIRGEGNTLQNMNNFWLHMKLASSCMLRVFARLDTVFVAQSMKAQNGVYMKQIWENIALFVQNQFIKEQAMVDSVFKALFKLITYSRQNHEPVKKIVQNTVEMLDTLGFYHRFETDFLTLTNQFYEQQSAQNLQSFSVRGREYQLADYIFYAGATIQDQYQRCAEFLLQRTKVEVQNVLHQCLISNRIQQLMQSPQLSHLFESKRISQVKKLYELFLNVNQGDKLRQFYEAFVFKKGTEVMEKIVKVEGILTKPKEQDIAISQVLQTILDSEQILQKAFNKAENFKVSHKQACERFINENPNFISQLLAKYLNSMLKRGEGSSTRSEENLANLLDKVMGVFKFLQGKDLFEGFYRRSIIRRLLMKKSISDDADTDILRRLKLDCGNEYTKKLEVMFNDIQKSEQIYEEFCHVIGGKKSITVGVTNNNKYKFTFGIQVIQSGAWPIDTERVSKVLNNSIPPSLLMFQDDFEKFYTKSHEGTRLTWDYYNNNVELEGRFYRMKTVVILKVNGFQALILLQFNKAHNLFVEQIAKELGISAKDTQDLMASFIVGRHKILRFTNGEAKTKVSMEDEMEVDKSFMCKQKVIEIKTVTRKDVQDKEQEEVLAEVKEHRGILLDSFIVRVMKTRKELEHESLMGEVIALCKFKFDRIQFKQRIEGLIEKEYIRRDDDDLKIYHYIS